MSKREGEKREEDRRNASKNEANNKKRVSTRHFWLSIKVFKRVFFFFSFAFVNVVRIEGYHHRTGHHHSQEGESTR